MTNVFVSWSGDISREIAEELRNWIPAVLQFAKPYFTPNDIEKGTKWSNEISKKLSETNVGIICLTKENLEKPWILFEAGALSKDLDRSKVCSILFGLETTDVTGPLTTFQATTFSKKDFKKLIWTINESGGDRALEKDTFDSVFEMWWPKLQEKISHIIEKDKNNEDSVLRPDRDLLVEILTLSRLNAKSGSKLNSNQNHEGALAVHYCETILRLLKEPQLIEGDHVAKCIERFVEITKFVLDDFGQDRPELKIMIDEILVEYNNLPPF
jgi:hypothetical protein